MISLAIGLLQIWPFIVCILAHGSHRQQWAPSDHCPFQLYSTCPRRFALSSERLRVSCFRKAPAAQPSARPSSFLFCDAKVARSQIFNCTCSASRGRGFFFYFSAGAGGFSFAFAHVALAADPGLPKCSVCSETPAGPPPPPTRTRNDIVALCCFGLLSRRTRTRRLAGCRRRWTSSTRPATFLQGRASFEMSHLRGSGFA